MSDESILGTALPPSATMPQALLHAGSGTHLSNSVYPPPTPLSPTNSSLLARPLLAQISRPVHARRVGLQMLIIILRAVGSQLRADDPGALKIILDVQSKSSAQAAVAEVDAMASTSAEASGQSARARIFLSMLMTSEQQAEGRDLGVADGALPRLRKWLKTLGSAAGAHEPAAFKVGWEELVHANSRGRWWVIGSAWAGRSGGGGSAEASDGRRGKGSSATGEERLLALADTQRMNTDIRRKIFVSMGADDFVDAHGRLTRLYLAKAQRRRSCVCCSSAAAKGHLQPLLCPACQPPVRISPRDSIRHDLCLLGRLQLPELTLHRAATGKLLASCSPRPVPVTCLKVVHWSNPSQRTIFFAKSSSSSCSPRRTVS